MKLKTKENAVIALPEKPRTPAPQMAPEVALQNLRILKRAFFKGTEQEHDILNQSLAVLADLIPQKKKPDEKA